MSKPGSKRPQNNLEEQMVLEQEQQTEHNHTRIVSFQPYWAQHIVMYDL